MHERGLYLGDADNHVLNVREHSAHGGEAEAVSEPQLNLHDRRLRKEREEPQQQQQARKGGISRGTEWRERERANEPHQERFAMQHRVESPPRKLPR